MIERLQEPVAFFLLIMTIILITLLLSERVRLPGIVGIILGGVLIGPHGFGLLEAGDRIEFLAAIEITRLGMNEKDMEIIADFIVRVLVKNQDPESVGKDVVDFRHPYQTLYYNFDNGYPAWAKV